MRARGRMFVGRSNGHHDAVRISPENPHFIQVRYDDGRWYNSWGSGGLDIVMLEWQDNNWVDAIFADGRREHAEMLLP